MTNRSVAVLDKVPSECDIAEAGSSLRSKRLCTGEGSLSRRPCFSVEQAFFPNLLDIPTSKEISGLRKAPDSADFLKKPAATRQQVLSSRDDVRK